MEVEEDGGLLLKKGVLERKVVDESGACNVGVV